MIKKILCLLFCTLLILTVFPVSVNSLQKSEKNGLLVDIDPPEDTTSEVQFLGTPGYMPTPRHSSIITKTLPFHPIKQISSTNDIVIQMLEEIDETMILGYLENLTSFGPRLTGTSGCIEAAEYIYNEFQSMGLDVRYDSWNMGGYSSDNVEATLIGTDESSDEIYIVCGHYDTVSGSPGADDDGSGTITTMVAAYVMSQYSFEHTIRFVAFSGEEEGLLGSEAYAAEAYSNEDNIIGVLNADMIGFAPDPGDENLLKIYEDDASEWLFTFTDDINDQYNQYIQLDLIHSGYTWGSDHNSFWDYGYDALFYHEYNFNDYYHSPQDTIEHMNIPYTTKGVKLITATLAELAKPPVSSSPEIPTIIGPIVGVVNEEYSYNVTTIDPDGDEVYYFIDWGDETNTGWIGPYLSGEQIIVSKIWNLQGEYEVRARAKDVYDVSSEWSEPIVITIVINSPPNIPTINGPTSGTLGESYDYTISTTDPEDNDVYYWIEWFEGCPGVYWQGPYGSGDEVVFSHIWDTQGDYMITVTAKDIFDENSDAATLKVTIPRTRTLMNSLFLNIVEGFPILQKFLNWLGQ